jgi:hypothetical protein
MIIRDAKLIKAEIDDVDSLLYKINSALAKTPDDFSLNMDLKIFQDRKRDLLNELSHAYDKLNVSTMEMTIDGEGVNRGEINIETLGKILLPTQPMLSALSVETEISKTGQIPENVISASETKLCGVTASSFKMLLKNTNSSLPIGNDEEIPFKKAFKNLKEVVECGDDYYKLEQRVEKMNDKALLNYRNFVNALKETNTNVKFNNPVLKNNEDNFKISSKKAGRIFNVINKATEKNKEENIENGELVAIDKTLHKIKIHDIAKNKNISIDFDEELED